MNVRFNDGTTVLQKTHHTPGPEDYRRTHMGYFGRRGVLLGQLNLSSLLLNGTEFYLPFQCGTRTEPSSPTGTSPRPRSTQATPRLAGEAFTLRCTLFITIHRLGSPRFQTETFASFVTQGLGRWLQTVQDWAQHSTSLHLVFYEVRSNNSVSISSSYLPTIVYQQNVSA